MIFDFFNFISKNLYTPIWKRYVMVDTMNSDVVGSLEFLKKLLSEKNIDTSKLRDYSSNLMEEVSLNKNQDSISLSVLSYSLYKILSKNSSIDTKPLLSLIDEVLEDKDSKVRFRASLKKLFDQIKKYDVNLDANVLHIIKQAYINKGIKLYENGLSIGKASEIMGISKWEIMEYLGSSNIVDTDANARIDCRDRLEFTRGLFQ